MSRGLRLGSIVGYPVFKTEASNSTSVTIDPTSSDQVLIAPYDYVYSEVTVNPATSAVDPNIIPRNIKTGVTILGVEGTYTGENYVAKCITNGALSASLPSTYSFIDTHNIKDLGDYVLAYAYYFSKLTGDIIFYDLEKITGERALYHTLEGCNQIGNIYFPSLKSNAFGKYINQLESMLANITTSHVLHFPSNVQSEVEGLLGYPTFGGGNNITCVFDLTATE